MKAASFLSINEAVALCGLDQVTLGAPIVEGLAKTELTAEYAQAMREALEKIQVASDAELEQYGPSWLPRKQRRLATVDGSRKERKVMLDWILRLHRMTDAGSCSPMRWPDSQLRRRLFVSSSESEAI